MGTLWMKCSLWEGPTLEKFMNDCIPWVGPHAGAGEEHEREGAAEMKHYECIMNLCVRTFTHEFFFVFSLLLSLMEEE